MPVFYQPVDSLYCVRAVYSPIDPANLKVKISATRFCARDRAVRNRPNPLPQAQDSRIRALKAGLWPTAYICSSRAEFRLKRLTCRSHPPSAQHTRLHPCPIVSHAPASQAGIRVLNTAKSGSVDGKPMGSSGGAAGLNSIVALPSTGSGPTAASKLRVGPGFLQPFARLPNLGCACVSMLCGRIATSVQHQASKGSRPLVCVPTSCSVRPRANSNILRIRLWPLWPSLITLTNTSNWHRRDLVYGPYWVVAFADDYSWAIISGGPPKVSTPGACSAGRPSGQSFLDINGSGEGTGGLLLGVACVLAVSVPAACCC
jgi:hypothetical protein